MFYFGRNLTRSDAGTYVFSRICNAVEAQGLPRHLLYPLLCLGL